MRTFGGLWMMWRVHMMSRLVWTLPMLMSVVACGTNGPGAPSPGVGHQYCLIAKPIWFYPTDRMAQATEDAILRHNETWERLCAK